MKIRRTWLAKAVLTSSVFCFFPSYVWSAANLDAGANNQNSGNPLYPPNGGYDFVASNVNFTILNGANIGQTGGISIDNAGFVNDVINFAGTSTILGTIGNTNAISAINLQGSGATVTLDANIVKSTPIIFQANGNLSLADTVQIFDVDNQTGGTAGTLIFQGTGIAQNVGVTKPLSLVTINSNGGVKTVVFDGTVLNANTINVVGGTPNATTLNLNGAGMVATGNFTTNNNNLDIFTVAKTATINGNIGNTSDAFAQLNIQANTTLNGEAFVTNTVIFPATILTLTSNSQITGTINGTAAAIGTLIFDGNSSIVSPIGAAASLLLVNVHGPAGSNVNLDANVSATNVTVDNGGTLTVIDPTFTITGNLALSNGSILSLANNTNLDVTGTFTLPAGTTLQVDMGGNLTTTGEVTSGGLSTVSAGATLSVVNPGFSLGRTNFLIPVVNSVGGAGGLNVIPVEANSLLSQFTTQINGNVLNLVITSVPMAEFANQSNTQGVAEALDSIVASGFQPAFGAMSDLLAQIGSFTSTEELNEALETLAPIVDGGFLFESFNLQQEVFGQIGERMDRVSFWQKHLPSSARKSGVSSGDEAVVVGYGDFGSSIWAKTFHQHAHQSRRRGIEGYSDNAWGIIAGYDRLLTDTFQIGGAFSVSQLKIHHHITDNARTKANSYQGTLYAGLNWDCPLFINGLFGFAYNDYTTHRQIFFGDLFLQPQGDYSAWQTGAQVEAGYIFDKWGYHLIPNASLFYSHLDLTGYEETGAGTVNQSINVSRFDTLLAGIGSKIAYDKIWCNWLYQPEAHANVYYALITDRMETTSQFIGAGPSFGTNGFRPARLSFDVGASVTLFTHTGFSFMASYDFGIKSEYTSHAGFLRARYELL